MLDKIIHGDCLEVLPSMKKNSVDYTITSPPYNRKRNDKYKHYNDTISNYFDFLKEVTKELLRITRKHVFFNIQATYYNRYEINKYIGYFAPVILNTIIWEKTNPCPGNPNSLTNAYEYIFILGKEPVVTRNKYVKNHITTAVTKMPSFHKAVMNKDVCTWLIREFTEKNSIILDPFFGTGTTGICAKELGRHYIGIEISKEYYDYSKRAIP